MAKRHPNATLLLEYRIGILQLFKGAEEGCFADAMLGIPEKEMAIDWNTVVFNMLTIKGIYGREMYETWYKMTVMLEGGLDIAPVITHRYGFEEFEKGFETALSGQSGKVILNW